MKTIFQTILFGLSLSLIFACSEKQEQKAEMLRPVKYKEIGLSSANRSRTFSATAQIERIINLSFRSSGIITELNLRLGQKVRKGQLLAKLDNVQANLAYEKALTQVNSAKSQMNTAKLSLNRIRSLYETGSASLSDFESVKNAYQTARASYQATKRSLDIQKEQIKYGYIYAPENGIIASVSTELDENVSPGQPIATLNAGRTMELILGLPESYINNVKEGMLVKINFTALPNEVFDGEISEVSPSMNVNTATYPVKIAIIKPSEQIRSGMAADVTITPKTVSSNEELIVPANAVGKDINGNFVFLLKQDKDKYIAKKQKVQIGELTPIGFEVKDGLASGDKIAVAGLQTLLDGQAVRLDTEK